MPFIDREKNREYQRKWVQAKRVTNPHSERRAALRKKVSEYKLLHGCARCGYRKSARALDMHHRDHEGGKGGSENGISMLVKRSFSWARIESELAKCEVLCSNCHREEHDPDLD